MTIRSQQPAHFAPSARPASAPEFELAWARERQARLDLELERERQGVAQRERQLQETEARNRKLASTFEDSPYPMPADGVDYDQAAQARSLLESRSLYEAYGSYDYLDIIGPGGYASSWGQPLGLGYQSYLNPLSTRVDRAQGRDRPFVITEIDLGFIRGIARIVCEVNCPAKGAIRSLVNYTVGGRGFQYTVAVKNQKQKPPDGLVEAVQEVVDEFLERVKWSGALGKEGELVRRWFRDGEYFLQTHCDRVGRTDIRFVEPEQITEQAGECWNRQSMAEYGIDIGNADIDRTFGILTPRHDVNTRWAYNAWFDDLGEADLLPAASLQHFKLSDTNIKRGISDFYGAVKWLQRSDSLLTKTAGGATLQASIAGIRKHAAGVTQSDVSAFRASKTDYTTTAYMPGGGSRQFNNYSYPDGTILDIPFGLDWDQPPAGADRGPAFVEVAQALLRWVATQWSMPEFLISGDASNNNYSCHDSETELMTKRGWLRYDQLRYGDIAGTMNPDTAEFEWQEIQAIHIHDFDGEMVRLKGKHNLDVMVTPNHRMWVSQHQHRRRDGGKLVREGIKPWKFVRADELRGGMVLPFACKEKRGIPQETFEVPGCLTTHINPKTKRPQPRVIESKSMPMASFLKFLGWWVSEGWTTKKSPSHHAHNVAVSQTSRYKEECDDISESFTGLPYNVRSWDDDSGMSHWQVTDKPLWSWLRANCGTGSYSKRLPPFVHDLPGSQQGLLLERMLLGDGSHLKSGSAIYFSVSTELADAAQMLAIQCGRISHRSKQMANGVIPVVCKRSDRHIKVSAKHISRVPYNGKVWCVTVPNGLIVTRRNGKSIVAGNSSLVSEAPFVKNIQGLQFGFGSMWHDLLWRVVYNAARYGRFDRFGDAAGYHSLRRILKIHTSFPTIETRDRNEETTRLKTLSDDGVISLETRAAEEGFDLAEEQAKGAKQRPAEITAKADGMDSGGGVTSLAGTEEKGKPGEPGAAKPEQPTGKPDVKQEQQEGGQPQPAPQAAQPKPAQPKPPQPHESAPLHESTPVAESLEDLQSLDQLAVDLALLKTLQNSVQVSPLGVIPSAAPVASEHVQESAALAEAVQHAPAGGATIAGRRFTGGQFIPSADMAKASPQEKAALKQKQEQAKAPEKPAAATPAEKTPGGQAKAPPAPTLDEMSRYQQLLGHLTDPHDGQHKERAKELIKSLEAKYGKQQLLGLDHLDNADNRDLNYALNKIKNSAPPETLDHFKNVLEEVRAKHPDWNKALLTYQGPAFAQLNGALRQHKPLDQVQQEVAGNLVKAIDAAGKLPKPATTYRGLTFSPEDQEMVLGKFKQALKENGGFTERAFVSQSLNPKIAQAYLNSKGQRAGKILLKITAKTGLFGDTGETELIQKPGTRFKVTGIDESGRYPVVSLEEAA